MNRTSVGIILLLCFLLYYCSSTIYLHKRTYYYKYLNDNKIQIFLSLKDTISICEKNVFCKIQILNNSDKPILMRYPMINRKDGFLNMKDSLDREVNFSSFIDISRYVGKNIFNLQPNDSFEYTDSLELGILYDISCPGMYFLQLDYYVRYYLNDYNSDTLYIYKSNIEELQIIN